MFMSSADIGPSESFSATAKNSTEKILGRLNMTKARRDRQGWKSLRQAVKSVYDIEELAGRL